MMDGIEKDAGTADAKRTASPKKSNPDFSRTLFVLGFPKNINTDLVKEMFAAFGNVDQVNTKHKYCFVRFETSESIDDVLAAHAKQPFKHLEKQLCVERSVGKAWDEQGSEPKAKKRKTGKAKKKVCYSFKKEGTCKYGDACKFSHDLTSFDPIEKKEEAIQMLRSQFDERKDAIDGTNANDRAKQELVFISFDRPASSVEKYYHQMYLIDTNNEPGQDMYCYQHSNSICVVGLAPFHPIVKRNLKVLKVDFGVSTKNLLENKVTGKNKKGGCFIESYDTLCEITTEGGEVFTIRTSVRGRLMEINTRLVEQPQLCCERAGTTGFLAILKPKLAEVVRINKELLSRTDYFKLREES